MARRKELTTNEHERSADEHELFCETFHKEIRDDSCVFRVIRGYHSQE